MGALAPGGVRVLNPTWSARSADMLTKQSSTRQNGKAKSFVGVKNAIAEIAPS